MRARVGAAIVAFILGSACLLLGARVGGSDPATGDEAASASQDIGTVLAFLDTSDGTVNRSQALVVRSIRDQFEERGIRVIVVQRAESQSDDERRNARYDWGLDDLTVLVDRDRRWADDYAVDSYPATLLLDGLGEMIVSWEGFSPAAVVGPVLEQVTRETRAPSRG